MYANNADGITWRVKQVIARALQGMGATCQPVLPLASPEEVRKQGLAYIDGLGDSPKADAMRLVFEAYLGGSNIKEVMAATGCSRGSVSGYLNEIERETGCVFIRGKQRRADSGALQAARLTGTRNASVRDFHSFRVTWITLALAAGVPLELVQRVTGHRTVEVVMKHYFRPGREDLRAVILKAMPKMLADGGGQRSVKEEIREILEGMTARSWKMDRDRALGLLTTS